MTFWVVLLLVLGGFYLWFCWPVSILLVLLGLGCMVYGRVSQQTNLINRRNREHSEICRRADSQHAAWLGGDLLIGVYGDYPPNQLFVPVSLDKVKEMTNPTVLPGMKADQHWPILKRVVWVADRVKTLSEQGHKSAQDFAMIKAGDRWLKMVAEQLGIATGVMVALARTNGASILTVDHRHIYVTGDGQVLDSKGDPVERLSPVQKATVHQIVNQRKVVEAKAQARKVAKTVVQGMMQGLIE